MPQCIPVSDLPRLAGQTLEPSSWLKITQRRINTSVSVLSPGDSVYDPGTGTFRAITNGSFV